MDSNLLLSNDKGKKLFLLGNEAFARGFIEDGGKVAATYPGTPSSEIGNTLSKIAKKEIFILNFQQMKRLHLKLLHLHLFLD
jgi:indolepyruvate ferredoxin oxidoreductase alpha subunit